jgi:hypothetical protein
VGDVFSPRSGDRVDWEVEEVCPRSGDRVGSEVDDDCPRSGVRVASGIVPVGDGTEAGVRVVDADGRSTPPLSPQEARSSATTARPTARIMCGVPSCGLPSGGRSHLLSRADSSV